jgi:hypothetical protein
VQTFCACGRGPDLSGGLMLTRPLRVGDLGDGNGTESRGIIGRNTVSRYWGPHLVCGEDGRSGWRRNQVTRSGAEVTS